MKNIPKVPAKIFDEFFQSLDLDEGDLEEIARDVGWQVREPRKISASALLSSLCLESIKGEASFNNLKAAPDLVLREGDLVLRDRGYLTMSEIARHIDANADCIYRHKTSTHYLDPKTRKPIDLLAELRLMGACSKSMGCAGELR